MHKSLSRFFVLALVAMALMMLVGSVAAVGPTVTPGDNTAGWTEGGGLRMKGQYGEGFYLGVPDLGLEANRVLAALTINSAGTTPFTFSYDQPNNALRATMPSKGIDLTYDFDTLLAPQCAPEDWDMMRISVRDDKTNVGLRLSDVQLDSTTLGTGVFGTIDVAGQSGIQHWTVTDYDFGAGFTLAGNLDVDPNFSGNEAIRVEIITGCAPPPPSVTPVSEDPLVCDEGTVDIAIKNVADLYGYQFKATYDASLVSAVGALEYGWFDMDMDGWSTPGWEGDCSGGVCQFARTELNPDPAISGSGVVASIDFTSLLPATPASFTVQITDLKLTDRDGFAITADAGSIDVDVCGNTTISGKISLQGRPWTSGVDISAPGLGFEVMATGPLGGPYTAIPSVVDGTYTITGVKYLLPSTAYTVEADHSLYLIAQKTPVDVSGPVTGLSTTLFGGDARNDGGVDMQDLACIANAFNTAAPALGTACGGGDPLNSPDINADAFVNIQDLSLAGGNVFRPEPTGW